MSTLARLVARVRDDTTHRLWAELEGLLTAGQRRVLDHLLEVPPGSRVSDLERWRKGPPPRGSGPAIIKALDQVSEIRALGLAGLGAETLVPPRRLGELARYGMTADAWLIRRHPDGRRLATLLATKSSTSPGTSSGSSRNVPSQRTVTSWSANPAFMCSPRRRSTSFRSSSSRKNTRSRSACDGTATNRPYVAAFTCTGAQGVSDVSQAAL